MSSTGTTPGGTPVLTDGRVLLRPLQPKDTHHLVEQFSDPETLRWVTTVNRFDTVNGARSYLRKAEQDELRPDGPRHWAIEVMHGFGTDFAGYIDLHRHDSESAGVDFGLHPQARGRHVMSSAIRLVCRWWFEQGGERVTWFAESGNVASWHVVRACGFRFGSAITVYLPPPIGPIEGWVATVDRGADLTRPAEDGLEPEEFLEPVPLHAIH